MLIQTAGGRRERGFTLTEVLIVIVIVGILAGVALPAYQSSMQKTRRTDAKVTLNEMAQRLQRCFTQFGRYNDGDNCPVDNPTLSDEGFYEIVPTLNANNFSLTASPATVKNAQAKDTNCKTLTLTSTGQESATGDAPDTCW